MNELINNAGTFALVFGLVMLALGFYLRGTAGGQNFAAWVKSFRQPPSE